MTLHTVLTGFDAPDTPGSLPPAGMSRFLAFDTSTDVMSIALTDGVRLWQHSGPGGARASTTLIPAILALLARAGAEAGLSLDTLDAIAFGQGPGSFTGLRTACAVAQGLAFGARGGAGLPVLPVPTLLALAEEARRVALAGAPGAGDNAPRHITALLDARMDEMYVQTFALHNHQLVIKFDSTLRNESLGVRMIRPENLVLEPAGDVQALLAGNVFAAYAQRLPDLAGHRCITALPTATAMLRLAPALAASGACVPAAQALPLYVRNKVAQTTAERAVVAADKAAHAARADQADPAVQTAGVAAASTSVNNDNDIGTGASTGANKP